MVSVKHLYEMYCETIMCKICKILKWAWDLNCISEILIIVIISIAVVGTWQLRILMILQIPFTKFPVIVNMKLVLLNGIPVQSIRTSVPFLWVLKDFRISVLILCWLMEACSVCFLYWFQSNQRVEILSWQSGGNLVHTQTLRSHTRAVSDLNWHRFDPNLLASCSIDTYIHVWDIRDQRRPSLSLSAVGKGITVTDWWEAWVFVTLSYPIVKSVLLISGV